MAADLGQKHREFWLKVIRRAQDEAEGKRIYGEPNTRHKQYLAQRWLTTCNRDFELVCEMAGFTRDMTQALRELSRRRYKRGPNVFNSTSNSAEGIDVLDAF